MNDARITITRSPSGYHVYKTMRSAPPDVTDDLEGRILWVLQYPGVSDKVLKRCWRLSELWGFSDAVVVYVFTRDVPTLEELWTTSTLVGPDHLRVIRQEASRADMVVLAWGEGGTGHRSRHAIVKSVMTAVTDVATPTYHLGARSDGGYRSPETVKLDTRPLRLRLGATDSALLTQ